MGSQAETHGLASDAAGSHPDPDGILVEELRGIARAREVEELQGKIWGSSETWTVPAHVLLIVSDNGGLLLGAQLDGALVGFVLGLLARQDGRLFHASHMLGVLPAYQKHGIGAALKWRQRALALDQGLDTMTWTFDPLEARNAYFNLHKLGTTSRAYREDYYGAMQDELNRDLPSDRLLVHWDLRAVTRQPRSNLAPDTILHDRQGTPELRLDSAQGPTRPLAIQIPRDIQMLKHETPENALAWRLAVRAAFNWALDRGYEARDFRDGAYVLEPRAGRTA